jgi:multiple sugar transport system permease protein
MSTSALPLKETALTQPIEVSARQAKGFWRWLHIFLLIFFAVIMVVPFVWLLSSSFKTQLQIFQYPPALIPEELHFENYTNALTYKPFHLYFRNTMIVVTLNVIAVVFTSSFCAYGFARMRFKGRDFWFGIVLATLFLPTSILLVPNFMIFQAGLD